MTQSIAITGATGFIGSALAAACQTRGLTFSCLVREPGDKADKLRALGARVVIGDLQNKQALASLCEGATAVIHCAAFMGKTDRERSDRVNIEGTENLLQAAGSAGVKVFEYVSSISVYRGTESATRVFTEELEPHMHPGLNNYSRSKLQGEHVVKDFCSEKKLNYIIVRPTNVYGPGCRPWGSDVEKFVKKFHLSFGNIPFNFVHIDDLVDGMLSALADKGAYNQDFNLGTEMVPLREFYEYIAKKNNVSVIRIPRPIDAAIRHGVDLYAKARREVRSTGYTQHFHYPHDKAHKTFGYAPKHSVFGDEQ